ncbi:MAG: hypothetical protein H0V07_07530 [Propionibacteriales bacterium]|nr:hypothetical protein [Propionibacteriales bacterium]
MSLNMFTSVEEQTRDLPAPPLVFGLIGFGLLLVLLLGLLMFGKGRPHS